MPPSYKSSFRNGKVTASEVTGGCWIDGIKDVSLHEHHIIPRANGGTDGPLALLCSSCHNAVHDAAIKRLSAVAYVTTADAKHRWKLGEESRRAQFLITTIITAEEMTKTSANKTTKMNLVLSAPLNRQLEHIARRLKTSKVGAIEWLISNSKI